MAAAAAVGDHGAYLRANWAFHSAIYRASGSQLLVSLIEPTWLRIGPYVRLMLPDRRNLTELLGNHLRAVDALRRRDPAAARQAIVQDITDSAEGLARMLRAREDQKGKRKWRRSRRRRSKRVNTVTIHLEDLPWSSRTRSRSASRAPSSGIRYKAQGPEAVPPAVLHRRCVGRRGRRRNHRRRQPRNGREARHGAAHGRGETRRAILAADRALPAWRAMTGKERSVILRNGPT